MSVLINETALMEQVPRHLALAAGSAALLIIKLIVNTRRNETADAVMFWILLLAAAAMSVDIVASVVSIALGK